MADAKTRKQRMRARRQQAGMKAELVWLTADGQAAMAAPGWQRSGAGETVDAFVNRALITLQALTQSVTSHIPSHKAMTADMRPSEGQAPDRVKPRQAQTDAVTSPVPSHVPKDAPSPAERPSYEAYRAMILQRIQAMRASTPPLSWQKVADAFNAEGLPTLSGRGRWDKSTVASLAKKSGGDGST
jgi:hypothetical protein